jgi:ketoreductase
LAELTGRIALVTGGGRGIGREAALALAWAGADVAVAARSGNELADTVAAIRATGQRGEAFVCDVTDRAQVDAMFAQVKTALGEPLILVNNAGIAGSAKLTDTTDEMWDRMLRVNATGAFYCTRAVLPMMLQAKWGRIVNVASIAAKQGAPYIAAYAASKHALLGLTRAVAAEVATRGITVNAVCPGYVETPLAVRVRQGYAGHWGTSEDEVLARFQAKIPLGRYSTPEEVAGLVGYLAGDTAASITAQALNVCGGLGNY